MSVDDRSDAEIVAAVLNGDDNAYGVLVARYQSAYLRYATRMLNSQDDAEDALQSAFIRAYRNLASCRDPKRFGSWLQKIVVNECRTVGARRTRRELRFDSRPATLDGLPAKGVRPEDGLVEEIQSALHRLPTDQREAFLLRYVEDLGYEEMSELTGAGISALKMRVKRACEAMRVSLEGVVS
jgi:RNA polymerase sigma-70 factor (ECF subfamily)